MAVSMSASTATRAPRARSFAWGLAALGCVLFGVMAMQFNFALREDHAGWWTRVQTALTSEAYSEGAASAHAMYPTYRRALTAMSSHTLLGGLAITVAVAQFVPALRRRYRVAHRVAGGLVILIAAASMMGALFYLARTPLAAVYASPAFGLALWALALACLGALAAAVLAIRRRDFRSHMGFMALMMATLLTAPVLRLEWALFGMLLPYDMHEINQGVVSSLAVICILVMTLWMHHVGARDLPARGRALVPSKTVVSLFAGGAAAVILHEGLFAPLGLDVLGGWRGETAALPRLALVWALPAAWLAWRVPDEIARVLAGQSLTRGSQLLLALVALGALIIAMNHPQQPVDALGMRFYWAAYGGIGFVLLWAGQWSRDADEPWRLLVLFMALAPALWPALWLVAHLCAQPFAVAMWFAATVALTTMTTYAFLTAFGVRLPIGVARAD